MSVLEVKFIGDGDVLEHIVDKQEGKFEAFIQKSISFSARRSDSEFCVDVFKEVQSGSGTVQKMVTFKSPMGRRTRDDPEVKEGDGRGLLDEQNYVQALYAGNTEGKAIRNFVTILNGE